MSRAEWHGALQKREWRRRDLEAHLGIFRDFLDQHGLGTPIAFASPSWVAK